MLRSPLSSQGIAKTTFTKFNKEGPPKVPKKIIEIAIHLQDPTIIDIPLVDLVPSHILISL